MNISSTNPASTGSVRSRGIQPLAIAVILTLVTALLVLSPQAARAASSYTNVDQVLVDSFVDAGVAISMGSYDPASVDAVVLATDANFPDGLTASAVAAAVGGPVLFTPQDTLAVATANEIDRLLDPGDTVYVMGGAAAISSSVEAELAVDHTVTRLQGATRLETAADAAELVGLPASGQVIIARAFGPDGANTTSDRTTGWVDAVSCGAYAAANDVPILLTETDRLSDTTAAAIDDLGATSAIVCGGTAAVGDAVADALRTLGLTVNRIAGPTRVETAIDAAKRIFGLSTAAGNTYTIVNGYGENFGYGLAAAPLGDPILLVGAAEPTSCEAATQPSRETLCYLALGTDGNPAQLRIVGDESIIGDAVANAAGMAAGGADLADLPPLPAPGDVDAADDIDDDGTRATVTWTAVPDPDDILAGYNVYVDGIRQGGQPTVGSEVTTFEASGLTPDEEVTVTVTSLDLADRESAPSQGATVTPTDEVPSPITGFDADAGNAQVELSWDPGPVDFGGYTVRRSEAMLDRSCPGGAYSDVGDEITDRNTTMLVDDDVTNDTTYCYRITVTDVADQVSDPTDSDPTTPGTGPPSVSITNLTGDSPQPGFDGDTLYFGQDFVVEYTVTDPDTDFAELRQTWELSNDGGTTYGRIGAPSQALTAREGDPDGSAQFTIPTCTTVAPLDGDGDTTSAGCVRDEAQLDVRVRVTVTDGGPAGSDRAGTTNLEVVRTPGPVQGLAAVPGPGRVSLSWDRLDNRTVADYVVLRDSVNTQPDAEPGPEVCPDPTLGGNYTQVATTPQTSGSTKPQAPGGEVDNGTVIGGTQVNDVVYCYYVQARRTDTAVGDRSALSAANPAASITGAIALSKPAQGANITTGQREAVEYTISVEDGSGITPTGVVLSYCLDFRQAIGQTQARCQDADGFKDVPAGQVGPGSGLPASTGANAGFWDVPSTLSQPDAATQGGAVQVTVTFSDGSSPSPSRKTGILFS